MILVDISGACAAVRRQDTLTAGMVGALVEFRFDDDWDGLAKTAVFRAGDITKDAMVKDSASKIPHEVLIHGVPLEIGVYGTKDGGDIVIPTVWAKTNPVKAGADPSGDEGVDPSLPIWAEIQEEVERIKENDVGGITEEEVNAKLEDYAKIEYVEQAVPSIVEGEIRNQKEPLIEEVTEKVLDSIEIPEGGGGAVIDDEDISADKTWSSQKISDNALEVADEHLNNAFYNMLFAAIEENVEGTMDAIYAGVVARLPVYNGEVVK